MCRTTSTAPPIGIYPASEQKRSPVLSDDRAPERIDRLNALSPADLEHLVRTIGEASLDLWSMGIHWPDLVDRVLETVEEEVAAGIIPVRVFPPA